MKNNLFKIGAILMILTLALPGETRVVEVISLAERREGSEAAAMLYRMVESSSRERAKND